MAPTRPSAIINSQVYRRERTREIVEFTLPLLKIAARYTARIQPAISSHPEKESADNPFAAALSDADLSVQTFIEVALLSRFPGLRFHGEEYALSHNTKYFPGIDLGGAGELLALLDPVDGTRLYVDQQQGYQTLFSLITPESYEAVIALTPRRNSFMYTLRDVGTFIGSFDDDLDSCKRVVLSSDSRSIFLGLNATVPREQFPEYTFFDVLNDYSSDLEMDNMTAILDGKFAAIVLQSGQLIDNVALLFMAQEAGAIVSTFDGEPLPPPSAAINYRIERLLAATSSELNGRLVAALRRC